MKYIRRTLCRTREVDYLSVSRCMLFIECVRRPLMPDFTDLTAVTNKAKAINVTPDFQGRWEYGKVFGKFSCKDGTESLKRTTEHFLQPPGTGMWHRGIPSSPGQSSAAKTAKPIPFLHGRKLPLLSLDYTREGRETEERKKHPLLSTILEREKEFLSCSPI